MSAFIIHHGPADERVGLLSKLAAQLGFQPELVRSLAEMRHKPSFGKERALLLVPDIGDSGTPVEESIEFAAAHPRDAFVIFVGDSVSADAYKRLIRTGAGEWIKWQALARELTEVVRTFQASVPLETNESATIVSLLPSKGGVGNTTIAVETAISLTSRRKAGKTRVAVLDLNFQGGTLADSLDVEARFDISEIITRPERLDAQLVEIFASRHPSGIDVLASPSRFLHDSDIPSEVVFAFLDEVSRHYDYVFLDLSSHWQPWFDNVLQGSSAVILTSDSTVPSVRHLANRQKHVDELSISPSRIAVVINQCETGIFGTVARKRDIQRAFPDRQLYFVVRDTSLATEAVNTGRPMIQVAPRRKMIKALRQVGNWIRSVREPINTKS